MRLSITRFVVGIAALASATGAAAETLRVNGVDPAGNDAAAALESIAIEQFGGTDGGTLSLLIGDQLRGARIDGADWFRIVPASLSGDADAALRGSVSTRIDVREDGSKEVSRCVKRDEKRKCIERRKDYVPCDRMLVRVSPILRLIGRDGELIHTDDSDAVREKRFCADENQPSADPYVDEALEEIAARIRFDLAPRQYSRQIRVLESRKGMDRALGRQFREAIRLTKSDEGAACDAFEALESTIGDHRSLLFNIGLCAEASADLDKAESYYQRTLAVDPGNSTAVAGMNRLSDERRALVQLSYRYDD